MAYQRVSLKQKSGSPTPVNTRIILIPYDDIDKFPDRGAEDVRVVADLVLKASAKAIAIYASSKSISRPDNQEGEEDEEGFIQTLTFTHPGNYLEIEEFKQKWLGKPFIAITSDCGDGKGTLLHGWNCNPVYFSLENQRNDEGNKSTFNFAQRTRSRFVAAFYEGALPELASDPESTTSGGL